MSSAQNSPKLQQFLKELNELCDRYQYQLNATMNVIDVIPSSPITSGTPSTESISEDKPIETETQEQDQPGTPEENSKAKQEENAA